MTPRWLAMCAGVLVVLLGVTAGPVSTEGQQKSPSRPSRKRGEALFLGKEALLGRLAGDIAVIPPELGRCANCHAPSATGQSGSPADLRLDRSTLLALKKRRGALPSAYTRDAFCRVVRSGVDPAFVVVAREMPRYALDEAQCSSLWSYLTDRGERNAR